MDPTPNGSDAGESRPVAYGAGRGGPVRSALRRAIEDSREKGLMTLEHEVRSVLAMRYADAVDRAARDADAAGMLRAGERLLELLDTLPIRPPGGGAADDNGGGERGQLLQLLDSPPTVGN